jgi:hypothetical protein
MKIHFIRITIVLVVLMILISSIAYSQEPVLMPGWPVIFHDYITFAAPRQGLTLFDVNNDGDLEIVFGLDNRIHCLDYEGNSLPGWPYEHYENEFQNSPVIGDIDGDGEVEIVDDCRDGSLIALNIDGTMCDGFPVVVGGGQNSVQMSLYDLDGDSVLEIIGGRSQSSPDSIWQIHVYRGNGEFYPGWPVDGIMAHGGIAVGDIDNDNSLDIISSGNDSAGNDIFAFETNGTMKNGFPVNLCQPGVVCSPTGPPVLFDIEGDGNLEIALLYHRVQYEPIFLFGNIAVLNNIGQIIEPWPLYYGEWSYGGVSVASNISSQDYYLSFGSVFGGHFFLSDMNAWLLPGWPYFNGNEAAGNMDQVVIGDIDGDGNVDYIFNYNLAIRDSLGLWQGRIWALNQDGRLLEHFPLWALGITFPGAVSLGDVDNDGIVEMAFKTDYPGSGRPSIRIFLFKLEGIPYEPERFPWPMSCHDPQHTNNLNFRIPVSVEDERTENIPVATGITGIYPNPFNTAATIEYRLDKSAEVSIEIFNLLGRKVATLVDGRVEAGRHSVKWDASLAGQAGPSSGIYFARLTAGEKIYTERMTLLK